MSSIPQVSEAILSVLQKRAKEVERSTGFVQRSTVQLDGPIFASTTVLTWMSEPEASYGQLQHTAASLGVAVSQQAIEQRFSEASSRLLGSLFEEAVSQVISSEARVPALLARFNGVYLQDGTVISLPASLAEHWPGSGGAGSAAALRVQVRLELGTGRAAGVWLQRARDAERSGPAIQTPLPVGSLFVADMGYFTLTEMKRRSDAEQYWLNQAKATLSLRDERGQHWSLLECLRAHHEEQSVDTWVTLGTRPTLAARLIAVRVSAQEAQHRRERANKPITYAPKGSQVQVPGKRRPSPQRGKQKRKKVSAARLRLADWTIIVTNVPAEQLTVQEALVLLRCRWQIELLWKLWKQRGKVDTWRSEKAERIHSEIFAKLIGLIITHWLILIGCWQDPARSLVKAQQVVAWQSPCIALALAGYVSLDVVLEQTSRMMAQGCALNPRQKHPNTYQLVENPNLNSS